MFLSSFFVQMNKNSLLLNAFSTVFMLTLLLAPSTQVLFEGKNHLGLHFTCKMLWKCCTRRNIRLSFFVPSPSHLVSYFPRHSGPRKPNQIQFEMDSIHLQLPCSYSGRKKWLFYGKKPLKCSRMWKKKTVVWWGTVKSSTSVRYCIHIWECSWKQKSVFD